MKRTRSMTLCLACMILALMLVSSCGEKKVETKPEPAKVEAPPAAKDTPPPAKDEAPPAAVKKEEPPAAAAGVEKAVKESGDVAMDVSDNVYFDFDSSVIPDSQIAIMEKEAAWLKANPNAQITIEGHCDERGTEEYNIALGDRRAASAKSFLEKAGIAGDRMKTVSYGKEKPVAVGHNEDAWAKNRRAHFVNNK